MIAGAMKWRPSKRAVKTAEEHARYDAYKYEVVGALMTRDDIFSEVKEISTDIFKKKKKKSVRWFYPSDR